MGLFQNIKNTWFLSKCGVQIKHVMGDATPFVDDFIQSNQILILGFRDKGHSFDEATGLTCLYMLHNPQKVIEYHNDRFTSNQAFMLAAGYCVSLAERWPNHKFSPAVGDAIASYSRFTKGDAT